jgi:hypothetical protein
VRALTAGSGDTDVASSTNLIRFLDRLPSKYSDLAARPVERFVMPQGGTADGVTPEWFAGLLKAYSEAFDEGAP